MSETNLPRTIYEWRCEVRLVDEWIEAPLDEFSLISDAPFGFTLIRGGLEVGGAWRLYRDDKLAAEWSPVWSPE